MLQINYFCISFLNLSTSVEPVVSIQAPEDLQYLSDLSLSCRVSVPQKLHSHLLPYMTVTWFTPSRDINSPGEVVDDGESLSLHLDIPAVNETHNGVYGCRVVLQLSNNSSPITRDATYTLDLKGKVLICVLTRRACKSSCCNGEFFIVDSTPTTSECTRACSHFSQHVKIALVHMLKTLLALC